MKTIQKIVQAFLLLMVAGLVSQEGVAQCTVRAVVSHASCYSNNGSIQLKVTGAAPFRFEWTTGQKTKDLSQLAAGKYAVTVTDANGRKAMTEAVVQNTASMDVNLSAADRTITATVSGGTKPYQFVWNSISNSSKIRPVKSQEGTFKALAAGEYVVIVTDARGCSGVKTITIP